MDSFAEQIVKQTMDGKRIAIVLGALAAALVICAAVLAFMPWMLIPVALGCGFGLYFLASSQSWEAEYAVTNGDIDIDRIVARRDRKTIVRVHGDKIEHLLPIEAWNAEKSYDRVVVASASKASATWVFTYHSPKSGSTLVYFEPNDQVLEALKLGLTPTVLMETRRAQA